MRKYFLPILMLLSLSAFAVEEQTIELKDGGKVMVKKDGTMVHIDAAGTRCGAAGVERVSHSATP